MAAPECKPLGGQRTRRDAETTSRRHLPDQKYAIQIVDLIPNQVAQLPKVGTQEESKSK